MGASQSTVKLLLAPLSEYTYLPVFDEKYCSDSPVSYTVQDKGWCFETKSYQVFDESGALKFNTEKKPFSWKGVKTIHTATGEILCGFERIPFKLRESWIVYLGPEKTNFCTFNEGRFLSSDALTVTIPGYRYTSRSKEEDELNFEKNDLKVEENEGATEAVIFNFVMVAGYGEKKAKIFLGEDKQIAIAELQKSKGQFHLKIAPGVDSAFIILYCIILEELHKLNATNIRYISPSAYRVLTAVELGSRNHEVVPTSLVISLAKIHTENVHTILSGLCRDNLVAKVHGVKYDGYRLTYGGYDFLALKTLGNKDVIHSVGQQVGIGKESDIHLCATTDGEQLILKIHRLGRTSFRKIKEKRDYLKNRKTSSWLYLSRLAAMKEYAFMKVLKDNGFPVPTPVEWNRHCLVMELIDGFPLSQITEVANPGQLYSQLMNLLLRLAHAGLIHSDFNEFNLLVTPEGDPVLIDFPQMISTSHKNAKYYFDRDVECIRVFFRKRFDFEGLEWPDFDRDVGTKRNKMLDLEVEASGFSKGKQKEFEALMEGLEDDDEESDEDDEEENDSDAEKEEENAAESNDADKVNEANAPVEINLKSLSLKDEEEFDNSGPESDAESLDLPNNQLHHPHRDSRDTVKNARTTTNTKPKPVPLDKFEIKKRVAKGLKSGKKTTIKNEKGKMNGKRSAMETAKHSEAWG